MQLNLQLFGGRGASSSGASNGWSSLTRQFKNNLQTDGINSIQLSEREDIRKVWDIQQSAYKSADDITLDKLNSSPIAIYFQGDYGEYMNIYKNRNEMFKSINKEYGGFKEYTNNKRYSISYVGEGEFYLSRNRFAKGGWKWTDANGRSVEYEKQWKKIK